MNLIKTIPIDPGVPMSGVARNDGEGYVELLYLKLYQVFDYLLKYQNSHIAVIENSNLIKANWHGPHTRERVGKNKQVSQSIVDFCKEKGILYEERKPDGYSMHYKDKDDRYSPYCQALFLAETGWTGKSNEHQRAAIAMDLRYRQERKARDKMRRKNRNQK